MAWQQQISEPGSLSVHSPELCQGSCLYTEVGGESKGGEGELQELSVVEKTRQALENSTLPEMTRI